MVRTFRIATIGAASLALALVACGGSSGSGGPCSGDETRCDGQSFQMCSGGSFETVETCAGSTVCDPTVGCSECTPAGGAFCDGDDVVACGTDGTRGDVVETCEPGACSGGSCGSDANCTAAGVKLIYVVDTDNHLLSFDPEKLGTADDPFKLIGTLDCPAGSPWMGGGPATPFSMSVDRNALAWVLYSSGEIFNVSTQDASCSATSFSKGAEGFQLFGMGFVSDAEGSNSETLFISGGDAGDQSPGDLGSIDTSSMQVTKIGPLPNAELGPELTGTGDAKLYGYYPGTSNTYVSHIDKASGSNLEKYSMDPLGGFTDVNAWAFAQYGGKFYVFVTTTNGIGFQTNRVIELDPAGPSQSTVVDGSDYEVVGAGVSTCAPVVVD